MSPSEQPPSASGHSPRLEQAGASDDSIQQVHAILRREKPEPAEGYSPIPIFLLFLFAALIFVGGIYLTEYSGGYNPFVYDHQVKGGAAAAPMAPEGPPTPEELFKLGEKVYAANCVACHQASGMGLPGAFPPLGGSEFVAGEHSEKMLPRILLSGLQGPVEVKGVVYNSMMPPFGPVLKDRQIAAVLTYIRGSFGNQAGPIAEADVAAVRKLVGARAPWTVEELRAAVK